MTEIYLIRHAEADGNLYRRAQAWFDGLVTNLGYQQIALLEKRFEGIQVDAVYASPKFRARETAMAVAGQRNLPIIQLDGLKEIGVGVWEDMGWGNIELEYPKEFLLFTKDIGNWSIPGGERIADVGRRMREAILQIAAEHEGETVAAVSHSAAIQIFLASVLGVDPQEVKHCDNTGVTILEVERGEIRVRFMNDATHLCGKTNMGRLRRIKEENGFESQNLSFVPLDIEKERDYYMACREDAWQFAHGTMEGFNPQFSELAKVHAQGHPLALTHALNGSTRAGILELDLERGAEDGVGWIAFYYMDPKFREKCMSIQMLGQAISIYRSLGRTKIGLRAFSKNSRALGYYDHFDFKVVSESQFGDSKMFVLEKDISLK